MKKLHDPSNGSMPLAGFISGSGTNLVKILEREQKEMQSREDNFSPYTVKVIFSDNPESNAQKIGDDFGIPSENVIIRDYAQWCKKEGVEKKDLTARAVFDNETRQELMEREVTGIAYAGYMLRATAPLVESFLGVNVHPAPLDVLEHGRPKYTGAHAVRAQLKAGEYFLRATTHLVEKRVDLGHRLMISAKVPVEKRAEIAAHFQAHDKKAIAEAVDENQDRLKKGGDWTIFPQTLVDIADGKYEQDDCGNLYFEGRPIPNGRRADFLLPEQFHLDVKSGYGGAVILAGSHSDRSHIDKLVTALWKHHIPTEVRIKSAHKQLLGLQTTLNEYETYSGPLVGIAVAGGTDALSGSASFNSTLPIISCPPDAPNESCLHNPPGSSNAYIKKPANAARFAAQVLGNSHPRYKEIISHSSTEKIRGLEGADAWFRNEYAPGRELKLGGK